MWNAEACFACCSGVHALTGLTTCMYIAARGAENTGKQDGTKRCLNVYRHISLGQASGNEDPLAKADPWAAKVLGGRFRVDTSAA